MPRRKLRSAMATFLIVTSGIPLLYIPLGVCGIVVALIGAAMESERAVRYGMTMLTPAIGLLLGLIAVFVFAGVLNLLRLIVRRLRRRA